MKYLLNYVGKLACETDRFRDENDIKGKKTIEEEVIHLDRHTAYPWGGERYKLGFI